jgi:sugar phosphate isomerase/epimerase
VTVLDVPSLRRSDVETPLPGDPRLAVLSLNQATVKHWTLEQAVDGCARFGIPAIGLWRDSVAEAGLARSARLLRAAGLRVSTLCRGGFITASDESDRRAALDDNRRAVDEAAALGTDTLVLVVGGLPSGSRDLPAARQRVVEALELLAPYAGQAGVRLALEPLHPMYCADRAVVSTLGQAIDIAELFPSEQVGVAVDTFHVWWDPDVFVQIARAGSRIATFQLADFLTPLPTDVLLGRALMGDGHIEFPPLTDAIVTAGYRGDIEVEVFNAEVWAADGDEVIATMLRRYVSEVFR